MVNVRWWKIEAARTASAPPVVAPRPGARACPLPRTQRRDVGGVNDRPGQGQIEAVLRAVSVHRGQQDLAGTEALALDSPRHRIEAGPLAPAVGVDLPTAVRPLPRVDGDHHALGAELVGELGDEQWALDGGGVDRHFVGTGTQEPARVPGWRMPPPTVKGMNTCSAVRAATETMVARPSDEAVMSRNVSSSAPSAS